MCTYGQKSTFPAWRWWQSDQAFLDTMPLGEFRGTVSYPLTGLKVQSNDQKISITNYLISHISSRVNRWMILLSSFADLTSRKSTVVYHTPRYSSALTHPSDWWQHKCPPPSSCVHSRPSMMLPLRILMILTTMEHLVKIRFLSTLLLFSSHPLVSKPWWQQQDIQALGAGRYTH